MTIKARDLFERRKRRTRFAIKLGVNNSPRLSVFRSSKNIYAQVIDDVKGVTLVSASSIEKKQKISGANIEAASKIGTLVAQRAIKNRQLMQYAVGGLKKFQNSGPPNESFWISYHVLQKNNAEPPQVHHGIRCSWPPESLIFS